jgi:uncharacterized damage-inducible protein DinB
MDAAGLSPYRSPSSAIWHVTMSQRALTELLRGKGAHADPLACVEDISAEVAARQVAGFPHSIGQLVFHINYWMEYEVRRIRGRKPDYPEHNSESFPAATLGDAEWDRLRTQMAELLEEFAELAKSSPQESQREVESVHDADKKVAGTVEGVLWQMVVHTSYHVGQIALIRRVLGEWPPRGGGDTW